VIKIRVKKFLIDNFNYAKSKHMVSRGENKKIKELK
jgi:hypothetical protein